MAPKVKLLYFDGRGRGEMIRIMLSYGGVEFEDKRIKMEEWPQVKPSKYRVEQKGSSQVA